MVRARVRIRVIPSRMMTSFSEKIFKDSSAARRNLLLGIGSMELALGSGL